MRRVLKVKWVSQVERVRVDLDDFFELKCYSTFRCGNVYQLRGKKTIGIFVLWSGVRRFKTI